MIWTLREGTAQRNFFSGRNGRLELYLAIERARFQDRQRVLVNVDPETL
jgi:hypothetical protein